jgi:peptidyl-prolyl cis-trans isomerase A (cyclophilin A)
MPSSLLLVVMMLVCAGFTAMPAAADVVAKEPTHIRFDLTGLAPDDAKSGEGSFVLEVRPDWAPRGAARLLELVAEGFFADIRFFRVVDRFVAQFGISGDPRVSAAWRPRSFPDDPVATTNARGTISFATSGKDTRTTQLFINLVDNTFLDKMGFAPVGRILPAGLAAIDRIYKGAGERPQQHRVQMEGNAYLTAGFPLLSSIRAASTVAGTAGDHEHHKQVVAEGAQQHAAAEGGSHVDAATTHVVRSPTQAPPLPGATATIHHPSAGAGAGMLFVAFAACACAIAVVIRRRNGHPAARHRGGVPYTRHNPV